MWVHAGEKHHLPSTYNISSCFEEKQLSSCFSLFKKWGNKGKGALARLAILISCFDMCGFCVPETLIHLLPLCMKRTRQINSFQSPGRSCAMSDSSPGVIRFSASCLMPPAQALHRTHPGEGGWSCTQDKHREMPWE